MQGILFPADNIYKAFPNLLVLFKYYSSSDPDHTNGNILPGMQSAAVCTGTLSNGWDCSYSKANFGGDVDDAINDEGDRDYS